jgi:hypothetical protein
MVIRASGPCAKDFMSVMSLNPSHSYLTDGEGESLTCPNEREDSCNSDLCDSKSQGLYHHLTWINTKALSGGSQNLVVDVVMSQNFNVKN